MAELALAKFDVNGADEVEAEMLESWQPIDLRPVITGDLARPEPTILRREDGRGLLYGRAVNYMHGTDGAGKSMVAAVAALQELRAGHHVIWLDYEDDEITLVARLRDFGVDPRTILDHDQLHYVRPQTEATPTAVALIADLARSTAATLLVIDSVGEALGLQGANEDRDNEVTPWFRTVVRPLAAAGPAVLPIDHGTKSAENPLHPSGSKRKRAAVTGHHVLVEAPRPLSKESEGGRLVLTTAKDRHGNYTRGKAAAAIEFAIYPDGGMTAHVYPPTIGAQDTSPVDVLAARSAINACQALMDETGQSPSMAAIETRMTIKGRSTAKRAGIEYAAALGCLREGKGPRNARTFTYVKDLET